MPHSFADSSDRDALSGAESQQLSTVCWPELAINVKDKKQMSSAEMDVCTASFIRTPWLSKYTIALHSEGLTSLCNDWVHHLTL